MANSSSKPTLILVPGAWHKSTSFSKIISLLRALPNPYNCVPVDLPSVGPMAGSLSTKSWRPDVNVVRNAIANEMRDESSVLLITHSYGSIPAQEAVRDFAKTGLVRQLVLTGFLLDEGESILSFNKGITPNNWDLRVRILLHLGSQKSYQSSTSTPSETRLICAQSDGETFGCLDPVTSLYNDLPESEQRELVSLLSTQALVYV